MERKNYLEEKLTNEEKLYLKRIVMTAKNKYFEKNSNYINNTIVSINKISIAEEKSIVDEMIERYQEDIKSAIEFEEVLSKQKN